MTPELQQAYNTFMMALFGLLTAMLVAGTPVLATYLVTFIGAKKAQLDAAIKKVEDDRFRTLLEEAVDLGVKAADQYLKSEDFAEKKKYAVEAAQGYLNTRGVKVDLVVIVAAVENRVRKLKETGELSQSL